MSCTHRVVLDDVADYYVEETAWIAPDLPTTSTLLDTKYTPQSTLEPPTHSLYAQLDTLLREKSIRNTTGSIQGYSIQLYKGFSRSEAERLHERATYRSHLPSKLSYTQPHYTLWMGYFMYPLTAHSALLKAQKGFPQAMIVPFSMRISSFLSTLSKAKEAYRE